MTKEQYIQELKQELSIYPTSFQNDILEAFEEHFNSGLEAGQTEEEIMTTLGSIEEVMENIREMEGTPVVLANQKRKQKTRNEYKDDFKQNIKDTVKQSLVDIDIEGIIKESMHSVKEALEDINFEFETVFDNEIIEPETEDIDLSECTSIIINCPKSSCDIEVVPDDHTHYQFSSRKQLFSSTRGQLLPRFQNGILMLSMNPVNAAGKLMLFIDENVTEIKAKTTSGDMDITNVNLDDFTYSSTSGDINMTNVTTNQTVISCTSGDIDINHLTGQLQIQTTSGDVCINNLDSEQFLCRTISGDVECNGTCEEVSILTVSGDIETNFEQPTNEITMKTTSGDIELQLEDDDYCIETKTLSGDISNHTPLSSTQLAKHHYCFGDGNPTITLNTVSGDITIRM